MGRHATKIGEYWMSLPDYEYGYLRASSKTKEYYSKRKLEVTLGLPDEKTQELKLPFTKIFKIKKDKKTGRYFKDWESFDLRKTLWMELVKRQINIYLTPYVLAINTGSVKDSIQYYLESPLMDKRVQLYRGWDSKPKPFLIEGYETFEWFDKNCLLYE